MNHIKFREESITNIKPNPNLLGLVVLEISPTDLCNRTCSFCPRHNPSIYPNNNKHMSIDTAKLLNQQLKDSNFAGYICIAGYGEPLLNPAIASIIKELNYHYLELITNADPILKNKFNIPDLLALGISRILISDYDDNKNLADLASTYANVRIRRYIDDGADHYADYNFSNRAGTLWSIDKPIQRPCYIPSYKAMVDWNGDVLLCSHDWNKKLIFGNINEQTISSIWMSDSFVAMRKELIAGNRFKFKECANCNVNGTIMGKQYADYWYAT